MRQRFSPRRRALAAAIAVLGAYCLAATVIPRGVFWSPDEGAKFIQLNAIEWSGGLRYHLPYVGRTTDATLAFYPSRCRYEDLYPSPTQDGGVSFHWPIWFPLATQLFFPRFGFAGLYVIPILSGCCIAVCAGLLAAAYDPGLAAAAILLVGLGTPVFFYSVCFWEHTAATALLLVATVLGVWRRSRAVAALLAALCVLAAMALRPEMVAPGAALIAAWWATTLFYAEDGRPRSAISFRRQHLFALAIGLLLIGAAVALLSLTPRYARYVVFLPGFLSSNLSKAPLLADNLASVLINAPGLRASTLPNGWAMAALAACGACMLGAFLQSVKLEAAFLISGLLVTLEVSAMLVFGREHYLSVHGLLPIAPYLVMWAYAVPAAAEMRSARVFMIVTAAALSLPLGFVAVQSLWISPQGLYQTGLEWGPRYLLTLYPLLAVSTLIALHRYATSTRPVLLRRGVLILSGALVLIGVQFELRGLRMLYLNKQLVAAWQEALDGGGPVLTDVWWLPANAASYFVEHEMHCVQHPAAVARWLPAAAAAGRRTFTFASFGPVDSGAWRAPGYHVTGDPPIAVNGLQLYRFHIDPDSGEAAP